MSYRGEDGELRERYVVCPICGWNWVESAWLKRYRRNNPIKRTEIIIQVRKIHGGKKPDGIPYRKRPGGGFELVEDECLSLKEIVNDENFREIVDDLKKQVKNIANILIKLNVLSPSDFKK